MASQVPPKKGVAFNLGVNLYTSSGALITAPSSVSARINKDFSTAYEAASSVSVASTNAGLIKVVLDSTQMNGDVIAVFVDDDTANCVPFTATIYTAANLLDEISTAVYGESTKLSTAIYGESTKLSTLMAALSTTVQAESTRLSTAIYGESTKLSTQIAAIVLSSATVDSTALANAFWAAVVPSTFSTGTAGNILGALSTGVTVTGFSDAMMGRLGIVAYGTAQAADSTSLTLASSHAFGTDELNGAVLYITGDTGVGQSRVITDYASDKASVDAWTTTPNSSATYVVFAVPPASALMLPQVNVVQVSGDSTAADNAELFFDGTGYAGGTTPLVVKVGSIDTNALSAEAVSAGAVSKISSGLATDTAMSTSFAALSTKVDALSTTVQAESTRLSTAIYGESTKLSTKMNSLSTSIYGESTKLSTRIQALSALTSSGFSSVVSTLGGMGTAILAESTKLSTKVDALSIQMSSVMSEVENVYTLVDQESTKLSTGIASLSADLDTVASALSSGTSTPSTAVAAAVWDMELASTYSGQSLMRGMASVLLGKVSGSSGSTTVFRDVADGKNVVTAITDAEGNRTTVTLDLSS